MTWRENQRPATFRGVPFYTDSDERQGGRRLVVHEFPFSERPAFSEDLGKKGRRFTIEGYVVGPDYETARDRLITALETPGPGELNHARFGVVRVAVDSFRTRETRTDGGMVTFQIDFVETTAQPTAPTASVDTAGAVTSAVTSAKTSISLAFLAKYTALPAFFVNAAAGIASVTRAMGAILDVKTLGAQQVAALKAQLDGVAANAGALARSPGGAIDSLLSLFDDLTAALIDSVPSPSRALLDLLGVRLTDAVIATAEVENMAALDAAVTRLVLVNACSALMVEPFDSYDAALTARGAVLDALDQHLDEVTDESFPAFAALRVAVVNAVPGPDSDLPRLQRVAVPASLPSLVVAHRLYGDVDSELELVARNKLKNPIVVPGGSTLEVLTRG